MARLLTVCAVAVSVLSAGCAVTDHTLTKHQTQKQERQVADRYEEAAQAPVAPRVIESDAIWVNKRSVSMREESLPAIFRGKFNLGLEPASSFHEFANLVSRATGLRFSFSADVKEEAMVKTLNAGFRSEDDLKSTLDALTARGNMSWKYRGGTVEIFRFDTKVFQIYVSPGTIDSTNTISNKTSAGGSGSQAKTSTGQEYTYKASLDIWKGIQSDLKNILSRDGKDAIFNISEASNSVTVTATPATLAAVESYVKDLNAAKSRQVKLEVRVFTIDATQDQEFGLKWDLAYTQLVKDLGISLATPTPTTSGLSALTAVLGTSSTSRFANSKIMVNALSQLGTTSVAVEDARMIISGETAVVNQMKEISYLAEVTTNSVPNAGSQTSLKAATINEGFSMSVTPTALTGDRLLLRGFIDISSVDRLEPVSSGGQTITVPIRSTMNNPFTIQLKSGEIYLFGLRQALSGFEDSGNTGTALINTLTGGQHASRRTKKSMVVMIRPFIVNSDTN